MGTTKRHRWPEIRSFVGRANKVCGDAEEELVADFRTQVSVHTMDDWMIGGEQDRGTHWKENKAGRRPASKPATFPRRPSESESGPIARLSQEPRAISERPCINYLRRSTSALRILAGRRPREVETVT